MCFKEIFLINHVRNLIIIQFSLKKRKKLYFFLKKGLISNWIDSFLINWILNLQFLSVVLIKHLTLTHKVKTLTQKSLNLAWF